MAMVRGRLSLLFVTGLQSILAAAVAAWTGGDNNSAIATIANHLLLLDLRLIVIFLLRSYTPQILCRTLKIRGGKTLGHCRQESSVLPCPRYRRALRCPGYLPDTVGATSHGDSRTQKRYDPRRTALVHRAMCAPRIPKKRRPNHRRYIHWAGASDSAPTFYRVFQSLRRAGPS